MDCLEAESISFRLRGFFQRYLVLCTALSLVVGASTSQAKNWLYDSSALIPIGTCAKKNPVVWIDVSSFTGTQLTWQEQRQVVAEAFRFWWSESGADISFTFAHDDMTTSCDTIWDCLPEGRICDLYWHQCIPPFDVYVGTEVMSSCYKLASAVDADQDGCWDDGILFNIRSGCTDTIMDDIFLRLDLELNLFLLMKWDIFSVFQMKGATWQGVQAIHGVPPVIQIGIAHLMILRL